MTRLIDADLLRKNMEFICMDIMAGTGTYNAPLTEIDNAPTVEYTFEEAFQKTVCENKLYCPKKNVSKKGEWIPVSERLPEDMQRVLIWFEYYRYGDFNCMYQTYGFGYVCDGEWSPFINGETGWQDKRIIAWQPLPEPYKEADDEQ